MYATDDNGSVIVSLDTNGVLSSLSVVADGVNISSLTVSSINGQVPGGGSSLQFSTIGIPGGSGLSSFNLQALATTPLVEFSTVAGHTYTASVAARGLMTTAVVDTDAIISEIIDSAGNEIIGSWPLGQVSTLSQTYQQQVGGSITWKAGGTGAFFSLYPTTTGATARVDRFNLIDYGNI
jgi:hypothetical protein